MVSEAESCVMTDANDALALLENTNEEPVVVLWNKLAAAITANYWCDVFNFIKQLFYKIENWKIKMSVSIPLSSCLGVFNSYVDVLHALIVNYSKWSSRGRRVQWKTHVQHLESSFLAFLCPKWNAIISFNQSFFWILICTRLYSHYTITIK